MLNEQGVLCAICHNPPTIKSSHSILHVDHNHLTNEVRGLLCSTCNGNLGWFEVCRESILDYLN